MEFRENDRGKFLRITEEAHGRRNTIIVPSTGVDDFTAAIGEVLAPKTAACRQHTSERQRSMFDTARRPDALTRKRWPYFALPFRHPPFLWPKIRKLLARQTLKTLSREGGVAAKNKRYVYYFGDGHADGGGHMKPLLGGKGANLAEMTRIGLPVPPGFTITTEVCTYFYENKRTYPPELEAQVAAALAKVEKSVGKKLGDKERPLLVSVRSGARDSMPGMMDTILNLGMNDDRSRSLRDRRTTRALPGIPIVGSCRCMATLSWACKNAPGEDREPFESVIEHLKDKRYGKHDFPDADRHRSEGTCHALQSADQRADRKIVSSGSSRATMGRDWRGVWLVDE